MNSPMIETPQKFGFTLSVRIDFAVYDIPSKDIHLTF